MARAAEEVGFDTIWLGDHLLYRYADGSTRGPWEVWTMLAALAASTSRIRLGPLVAATAFHAPAMLAKMAATVDEISGGRLILGLGAGWNETEFRAFGFPFDHRISPLRGGVHDHPDAPARGRDRLRRHVLPGARLRAPARAGPARRAAAHGRQHRAADARDHAAPRRRRGTSGTRRRATRPAGLEPILRAASTRRAGAVGRDPADVEKTSAVLVRLPGGTGRVMGDTTAAAIPPVEGSPRRSPDGSGTTRPSALAEVQLVVDPITIESIEALAPVLAELDRG